MIDPTQHLLLKRFLGSVPVLMMLAIIQVGLLVRTRVLVTHAAREAVREAAVACVHGDPEPCRALKQGLSGLGRQAIVPAEGETHAL